MAPTVEEQCGELRVEVARLQVALEASDKALVLAREAMAHWQEGANQWRAQLMSERSMFCTEDRVDGALAAIGVRLDGVEKQLAVLVTRSGAYSSVWIAGVALVGIALGALALFLK